MGGECINPFEDDAGCGLFCPAPDAGKPISVKRDAGTGGGGGGSGGCGCSSSADVSGLLAMAFVGWALARRRMAQVRRPR